MTTPDSPVQQLQLLLKERDLDEELIHVGPTQQAWAAILTMCINAIASESRQLVLIIEDEEDADDLMAAARNAIRSMLREGFQFKFGGILVYASAEEALRRVRHDLKSL